MAKLKKPNNASDGTFYIRAKGPSKWYLYHEYVADNKKVTMSVPKELYAQFGVNPAWSVIEAKERVKNLNRERTLTKTAHTKTARKAKLNLTISETFFPQSLVDEFLIYLEEQTHGSETHLEKIQSHFQTIQKMIRELRLTPDQYAIRSGRIYKWLEAGQFSIDYSKKLIRVLNLWGQFYARNNNSFFEALKNPRGRIRSRIEDNQRNKRGVRRASEPLTFQMLKRAQDKLSDENYNWLYISIWFGLRPKEIDSLKDVENWKLGRDGDVEYIAIYQSKLTELSREDRWKYIPIIFKEQRIAIQKIREANFKRPLTKTIHKHVDDKVNLYGGRKGFEQLMLDNGQNFEDVADWLGHKNIDTTFKHYRNKNKVRYTKVN